MACVSACKNNAIKKQLKEDGHFYVAVDKTKCIECGACEKICNASLDEYGINDISKSIVLGAYAKDSNVRGNATSGGVFAAIAFEIIKQGGAVIGAHFDGYNCSHICIHDCSEISDLQGSKYVSSDLEGIHLTVENELKRHDVLFSGVGCQCASVLAYIREKKYTHNLYTIDLVCGGYPSRILLDKYLEENTGVERILSFRNKERYELHVLKNGIDVIDDTKNLLLNGFSCALTSRWSCYNCQFAKAHRNTNLTIGDLWDTSIMNQEHEKGVSTVIVHDQKGFDLLNMAEIEFQEIPWKNVLISNNRIVEGKQLVFFPRKKLIKFKDSLTYDRFLKLYCIAMTRKDIRYSAFRAHRYIFNTIQKMKTKRMIRKMLAKGN